MTEQLPEPKPTNSRAKWREYALAQLPDYPTPTEIVEWITDDRTTRDMLAARFGTKTPVDASGDADGSAESAAGQPGGAALPQLDPAPDEAVSVHVAWSRVMRDVGAISKDSRNKQQNFNFRGIDAVMNVVGPVLRRHGVMVIPASVEILDNERYSTSSGTAMHGLTTLHNWRIIGPRGDEIRAQTMGEAADAGDKVASKASSVAYRTFYLQALCIPTDDRDPDMDAHERATPEQSRDNARAADPRVEGWDAIRTRGQLLNLSDDDIRGDYQDRMGHAIDGPESTLATLRAYYATMGTPPATEAHTQPQGPVADGSAASSGPAESEQPPTDDPGPEPTGAGLEEQQRPWWNAIGKAGSQLGWPRSDTARRFAEWATESQAPGSTDINTALPATLQAYAEHLAATVTKSKEQTP